MGFFAAELAAILEVHSSQERAQAWEILQRMGVQEAQIQRLQQAADDLAQIATLPVQILQRLRQDLGLSPLAWARLQAGNDADAFLRLVIYHNFPLEEAANKANAVFAAALKDRLATGGYSDSIYPRTLVLAQSRAIAPPPQRRVRRKAAEQISG